MVPLPSRLGTLSSITHSFPWLSSPRGYVTYVDLPRSPLSPLRVLARLACLIHAANVHSEPGSNPFEIVFIAATAPSRVATEQPATECELWVCLPACATGNSRQPEHSCKHFDPPRITEPIWLTHAQQPLQYNKADFSEPSNQIVKEHRARGLSQLGGRVWYRLQTHCQRAVV